MKIKRIVLYNIGPYLGRNVFDLTVDKIKNIVLIGGKNGAGKTTFFRSIKTCLYGCKVWGFEAPGKEYLNIISTLVNSQMQYDSTVKAYIEVELIFDDGKQINSYVLNREWQKNRKNISEIFRIYKNRELLGKEETADFNNYLLSMIPPDMFNFYFFDGESIADFFLGNDGNKNFRNAFLKLYGLDTLSLMVENFERCFKKKDSSAAVITQYRTSQERVKQCEIERDLLLSRKQELETAMDLTQMRIISLQKEYSESGGISLSEWKEINAGLLKEETRREELNRWLKEIANNNLPFIILKKELEKLLKRLESEQEAKRARILRDVLNDGDFKTNFSNYLLEHNAEKINVQELIDFICNETVGNSPTKIIFDLSDSEINRLIAQIYEKSDFDSKSITKALSDISSSLKTTKKLREKIVASSIDGFEDFSDQKETLEQKNTEITLKLNLVIQELSMKEDELSHLQSEFESAKSSYEKILKNKSITALSTRAIAAYTLLEEKLVKEQGQKLQQEFIRCFKSIINKENFIDGIVIDKNINIIPYKFIDVTIFQIDNYIKVNEATKFLSLFDPSYQMEINKLRLREKKVIRLPSPISAPFSQGERQVYIMSIYLALLKTSRKDIPFFIDTPFARIDSNHREKIVKEFFSVISNQMFILSTDEEIVGEYEAYLKEKISDKFVLEINDYGNTKVVPNKYFEVL